MRNRRNRSLSSDLVIGIIAIGMGLLFLLDNLDIFDFHQVVFFWPIAFVVFGALRISQSQKPSGMVVGGVLILVGLSMTAKRLGWLDLTWHKMWPLVLIMVGMSVIFKAVDRNKEKVGAAVPAGSDDNVIDVNAILGGFQRRINSTDFKGGEITAIMGGCELDLREAKLNGEAMIEVFALCGGITIKVPADWTVVLQGTPILGGFEEKTVNPPDGSKRLVVRGYAIMGGMEVRN